MKKVQGIIAGMLLSTSLAVTAEITNNQTVVYPINMPCTNQEKIEEVLKNYKEVPFANGVASFMSAQDNQYYPGNFKIYLSFDGSFTVTAEMNQGVICIITTGEQFTPIVPSDEQLQEFMN